MVRPVNKNKPMVVIGPDPVVVVDMLGIAFDGAAVGVAVGVGGTVAVGVAVDDWIPGCKLGLGLTAADCGCG